MTTPLFPDPYAHIPREEKVHQLLVRGIWTTLGLVFGLTIGVIFL